MKIIRTPTSLGLRSLLDYRYAGKRYRPVVGYDLSSDQEKAEVQRLIAIIHANVSAQIEIAHGPTVSELIGEYLNYLRAKKLVDIQREEVILLQHVTPLVGSKPLSSLGLSDGLEYLKYRRAAGAAEGTIRRECNTYKGMLTYAVARDLLRKNPFALLPIPEGEKRARLADPQEIWRLIRANPEAVGRMTLLGLLAPLREAKLIQAHVEWIEHRADGPVLHPSPGSRLKRVPKALPIGPLALALFHGEQARIKGRFFGQWANASSFKHRWSGACFAAGVHDLHFHDLRHTALSWLLDGGADYGVVQRVAGHKLPGVTEDYLHLWDKRMREAMTLLEKVVVTKLLEVRDDSKGQVVRPSDGRHYYRRAVMGSSWTLAKLNEACNLLNDWCRGTESNCRHQPFQGS